MLVILPHISRRTWDVITIEKIQHVAYFSHLSMHLFLEVDLANNLFSLKKLNSKFFWVVVLSWIHYTLLLESFWNRLKLGLPIRIVLFLNIKLIFPIRATFVKFK